LLGASASRASTGRASFAKVEKSNLPSFQYNTTKEQRNSTTPGVGKIKLGAATPTDFLTLLAGYLQIKADFDAHTHGGVQTGGGTTGAPSAPMTTPIAGTHYTSEVKAS
jgi:hypothetical protein